MKRTLKLTLLLMCAHLLAVPVAAQSCGDLETVRAELSERHGESIVWIGVLPGGTQVIIMGAQGGGFSILRTDGDRACMLAAGQDWTAIDPMTAPTGQVH